MNKLLFHSFVESPDVKNFYDGEVILDALGETKITLPDYFETLNRDYRYQLSATDRPMPNLHIKSEVRANEFEIAGGAPGGLVSWQVTGTRKDPYIIANPIEVEVLKSETALVKRGEYIHEQVRPRLPSLPVADWIRAHLQ